MELDDSPRTLRSAFDSPTFGEDASFRLDKPVGSASISPCGRDIVLASRLGLHIIDLDSPYSPPRYLPHHIPWEVADVQWSPFASRDSWVVSTSNQKALLWNLEIKDPRSSIEHVLHAHTRAITDINFSAHHPDILATCAVDSFVHCWDIRHPTRPAISFCDWFAGATQVKWNRQEPHIVASSHYKMLRIWDDRKGAYPLRSIEAHATKIYGVDWNRTEPRSLVTCSLDKTIKTWDYGSSTDEPQRIIKAPFPVWRARHTPFGHGLLAMPQRGDNSLHLYDRRSLEHSQGYNFMTPAYSFEGHEDRVKEFLWRPRGTIAEGVDNREFQLVSWGNDKVLRLHRVDENVFARIGHQRGKNAKPKINLTRKNAPYKTFRDLSAKLPFDQVSSFDDFRASRTDRASGLHAFSGVRMSKGSGIEHELQGIGPARSMAVTKNRDTIDMDPISWMKGVKIGRRGFSPSGIHPGFPAIPSTNLATSHPKGEIFESLGEEITHVGQKFSKVVFDEIDMLNRMVIFGLMGPWGSSGTSAWIKCRIQFPDNYPESAVPLFAIQDSPSTSDEQIQRICRDIQSITNASSAQQLSSLEIMVRYLLGEQDLSQSLVWLATRPNGELDVPHNSAESSSDEDEDLQSSQVNENLAASNAQYNVPLPKGCGALWADDGRLVCFFPQKGQSNQALSKLSFRPGSQKGLFEGFGRLNQNLAASKRPPTIDTSQGEGSDLEFSSSSPGSSTSSVESSGQLFTNSIAWHAGPFAAPHEESVDESYRSSGAVDDKYPNSNTNYVSIHACHDVLPSKLKFARDYILSSNPQQSCAHNCLVAAEGVEQDKADVWALVELIIRREVPLEIIQYLLGGDSVIVAAKRATNPLRTSDSAIDLSYDLIIDLPEVTTVKWGEHPFGSQWLVTSLFEYFDALADVQMLAMLSCVLSEPFCATSAPCANSDGVWQSLTKSNAVTTSDGYYIFPEMAHQLHSIHSPDLRLEGWRREERQNHSPSLAVMSPQREVAAFNPQSIPLSSGGRESRSRLERKVVVPGAPSISLSNCRDHRLMRPDSQDTTFSSSPEQLRHVPRSNSNLANAFAASLSRPFSFNASASSSSPPTHPRKRLSPAGSYFGAPPGLGWGTTSIFGRSSTIVEDPKPAYSFSGSDQGDDVASVKVPVFKTKLKNQQNFPNDDYASVPLLRPEDEWKYRAYRDAYAHMLFIWDMPVAMCEVLKYNGRTLEKPAASSEEPSVQLTGSKAKSSAGMQEGLLLQDTCSVCKTILVSSADGQACPACWTQKVPLVCLFCNCIIRGLASPCLSCGHVLHLSCRSSLSSEQLGGSAIDSDDEEGAEACISGCGCHCSDHVIIEIEEASYPRHKHNEDAETIIADEHSAANRRERRASGQADAWQDVAYESLAKNLGNRTLTPRSSQVWRGGDNDVSRNRKKSVGSNLRKEELFG